MNKQSFSHYGIAFQFYKGKRIGVVSLSVDTFLQCHPSSPGTNVIGRY